MAYPLVLYENGGRRQPGSSQPNLSLVPPVEFSGFLAVTSHHTSSSKDYEPQRSRSRMSQNYTAEQIRQFQEEDLAAQRINKLSWGFHKIPTSADHENYLKLKKEQRESFRDKATSGAIYSQSAADLRDDSATSDLDTAEHLDDDDELVYKWSWIRSPDGDSGPYKVLQDTGSTSNWISQDLISQLGLTRIKTNPVCYRVMIGKFTSDEYVNVSWGGKEGHRGIARCRVAPHSAPFSGILVGQGFLRKYPDALLDEQPDRRLLLAIQAKAKDGESAVVSAGRTRNEAEAADAARRRRQIAHNISQASSSASLQTQSSKDERVGGERYPEQKERIQRTGYKGVI